MFTKQIDLSEMITEFYFDWMKHGQLNKNEMEVRIPSSNW